MQFKTWVVILALTCLSAAYGTSGATRAGVPSLTVGAAGRFALDADATQRRLFACSWPILSTASTLNIAYPDSNAAYWAQPLHLMPGESLTIDGAFPGSRYFAFVTYYVNGSSYDGIHDAQIAARSGTNFFQSIVPPPLPPTGTYRVTVIPAAAGGGMKNLLPAPIVAAPGRFLTSWLLYRVYAPYAPTPMAAFDGGVALPTLTVHRKDGTSVRLRPCREREFYPLLEAIAKPLLQNIIAQAPTPAPEPQFQYNSGGSLFPNTDNKYVFATTAWQPKRLIVISALAPTFPDTPIDALVQYPPKQLRYWSMCTNELISPAPVVGCADDATTSLTPVDEGLRRYVYIVSAQADKPFPLPVGATWLPWFTPVDEPPSPAAQIPGNLILRNMLPDPSFAYAVQRIADHSNPTSPETAKAVMGPYYPSAVYCNATLFAHAYAQTRDIFKTVEACRAAASS